MGSAEDPKVTFVISMVLQLKAQKVIQDILQPCMPWNAFTAQSSSKMQNALWSDKDMQAFHGVMSVKISVRRLPQSVTVGFCSKIIILLILSVVYIKERKSVCLLQRGRAKQLGCNTGNEALGPCTKLQ